MTAKRRTGTARGRSVTVFAPATVANVAVGFDVLGLALEKPGDRVTVTRTDKPGQVEIEAISGVEGLPLEPEKNTATVGLLRLCEELRPSFGFAVRIEKGIPLGSGLGGSAASAVGAVVAANKLLARPLPLDRLLDFALSGEAVASGSRHADNVAPCLFGGLNLVRSADPFDLVPLPVPRGLTCVVVHPGTRLDTKEARGVLSREVDLGLFVRQSANLGAFVAACFRRDLKLLSRSAIDLVVEPQRAALIPGFERVQEAALSAGALACSISGAGPAIFALVATPSGAKRVERAMTQAFQGASADPGAIRSWVSPIASRGAGVRP